jgi:hypothetical protein
MHSREVIQKHLSKLQKLNYNQFRWWRNYSVSKTLPKSAHIEKRIDNGDFDPSPYFWMAQSALWEKHDSDNSGLEPFERAKRGGLLLGKYERLMNDHYSDDDSKLENFIDAIYDYFEVDKLLVEEEIKSFGSSVKDYYLYASTKYNVRRVAPKRRGRPKKVSI